MSAKKSIKKIFAILFLLLSSIYTSNLIAEQAYCDIMRDKLSKAKTVSEQLEIEINLAYLYVYVNADSVKHYATSVIRKSRQVNDNISLCHGYLHYSELFHSFPKNQSLDSTLFYIEMAYKVAEKASYKKGMATCFEIKGNLKSQFRDQEGAIKDLLTAKKIYLQSGDTISSYMTDFSIAQTYELAGNFDKAIPIYESIANIEIVRTLEFYVRFLEIVGSTYQSAKRFEKSLEYYKKAYVFISETGDNYDKHRISMKLASIYHDLGDADSTNYYFNKCISYSDSCKDENRMENDCVRLADICFDNKEFDDAEKFYLKSLYIVRQNGWSDREMYTLERVANFYQITKNYVKALDYLQQYIALKDSLKLEPLGYMLDKALSDQELLKKKDELVALQGKQAAKQNYAIVALSLLSLCLFLLVWIVQASLLFKFSKNNPFKSTNNQAGTFWKFVPPAIMPSSVRTFLMALLFSSLNLGLYFLIFENEVGILIPICWTFISLVLFILAEKLFFYYHLLQKGIPFRVELVQLFSGFLPFIVLLTFAAGLLKLFDFNNYNFVLFALIVFSSFFLTLVFVSIIQYRVRFEKLSEELIEQFNQKLSERQSLTGIEVQNEKSGIVTIENNGDNVEINIEKLVYIVSDNVYQEFICLEDRKIAKVLVRNTMSNIEKSLQEYHCFIRCHRSYIVNTNKIASIKGVSRQYYFVMENLDEKIPISRSTANNILEEFAYLINSN